MIQNITVSKKLQTHISRIFILTALCIFSFILLKKPFTLYPFAGRDDGLYVSLAKSIVQGDWLGPYNDRNIAKPPGFSLFIAASFLVGLPYQIAIGCFAAISCFVLAAGTRALFPVVGVYSATFVMALLSPQMFVIERILREAIYANIVMMLVGFALLWMASKKYTYLFATGLVASFAWITREDGIWLIPPLAFLLIISSKSFKGFLKSAVLFLPLAASMPVLIGLGNYLNYGYWTYSEMTEKHFTNAISATQSVAVEERKPGVAVTKSTIATLYEISPTFAKLRPALQKSAFWDFGCVSERPCTEIGNGWWHWAVREAAFGSGLQKNPQEGADFYRAISREIGAACNIGRVPCDFRLVKSLPTISFDQTLQIPSYSLAITMNILNLSTVRAFLEAPGAPSVGTAADIDDMYRFLNRPIIYQSLEYTPGFAVAPSVTNNLSVIILTFVVHAYLYLQYSFLFLAIISFCIVFVRFKKLLIKRSEILMISGGLFVLIMFSCRLILLSIVGISSFPTNNSIYIGPLYQLLILIFIVISAFGARVLFRGKDSVELPRHRGVS